MSQPQRDQREQEISIKRREGELFRRADADVQAAPVKEFAEYLRETPALPLPTWAKALLWAVGVVVALLFAAALWRLQSGRTPQTTRRGAPKHSSILESRPMFPATVAVAVVGRRAPMNPEKS